MTNHQWFLIQQMQKPDFYPHPVKKPIELVQTHASFVLLTGNYAYKIKKSVDFGFLDYSTLAKRQYFLNEELRLNKPIAPEIYLEILPITQVGDEFILGSTANPVEYLLKMHQFPQENLLINLFSKGKLKDSHLQELGKIVAEFHKQAQISDYIRDFGDVSKIQESVHDNYRQTEKYIGIAQTPQQYEETKRFTDTFILENQDVFKSRQEHGKIRECHGDLHLGNICLFHKQIQLFDRIEINEAFRFVDVMYDIAFTVMDLEARNRKDLGNIFLNTYIEQTGDWEGLTVLPYYLCRQAYVRAKVNSFLLDDPLISEQAQQEAAKTAADYYRLAWNYTQKSKGRLFLMSGLSGSGKTTVARHLAQRLNGIYIRSDAVRKHLAGISLEQPGDEKLYTAEMTQKTYDRLLRLGIMLADRGFSTILDAKYDRHMLREQAFSLAKSHQLPIQVIHCTAPIGILRDRLSQRTQDISDATPDLLIQQKITADPFTEAERAFVVTIDTAQPEWASRIKL